MFNTPSNKRETHFHTWVFIFMISWLKLTKMYFVSYLLDFDTGNMVSFDIKYFFLRYRDLKLKRIKYEIRLGEPNRPMSTSPKKVETIFCVGP